MIGIGPNLAYQPAVTRYSSGADLEFDFTKGSIHPIEGSAALVVTRAGATATQFNAAGVLEVCAADTARLQHDPSVLEFENLWTWSVAFGSSEWWRGATLSNFFTVTDNAKIGPTGLLDATKFESTASTIQGLFLRAYTSQTAGAYNTSIHIYMPTQAGVTNWSVVFDAADSADSATSSIQTAFDQWVRVTAPITYSTSRAFLDFNIRYNGSTAPTVAGFTFYASRAQLNTGSTALAYRPTQATAQAKQYVCEGLLVEDAATNHAKQSGQVGATGTYGNPSGAVTTLNAAVSPDGTMNASVTSLPTLSGGSSSRVDQNISTLTGLLNQTITFSIFLRGSGTLALTMAAVGGTGFSQSQVALSSTWTRYTLTGTFANTGTSFFAYFGRQDGVATATSVESYGFQVEARSSASSYIPTTTTAVTRNADTPDGALGPWFNASEGTILFSGAVNTLGATNKWPWLYSFNGGTNINCIGAFINDPADDKITISVTNGGASQSSTYGSVVAAGVPFKCVHTYKANDFAFSQNGGAALADTNGSVPAVTRLRLGNGDFPLNGTIKRFAYWRTRKSNADLPQMSA